MNLEQYGVIFNTTNGFGTIWNNKKQQNSWEWDSTQQTGYATSSRPNGWEWDSTQQMDLQQHEIDGDLLNGFEAEECETNGFGMINEHQNHKKWN